MEDETNKDNISNYCDGLQQILNPTQNTIKIWIREKLTC